MKVNRKKIAVIDGNSWLHRAYHAVPPNMWLSDNTPTNAVHGFLNMLLSFYQHTKPEAIFCAFDSGIPDFRLQAVKSYKAQRKPMDNELRVQFPIIEEILTSLNIPVVKKQGWEGDDILGTISYLSEQQNMECLLVTGDKDANQLASEYTKIVNMKKGVSSVDVLGPKEVLEKYGIKPEQFIDYLALTGDTSDNIPGVSNVGPKRATLLLQKYGCLDNIYCHTDEIKGKVQQNIINDKDMAYISKLAATIKRDVDINVDLKSVCFPDYNISDICNTFIKYELKSTLKNYLKLINVDVDDIDINIKNKSHANSSDQNTEFSNTNNNENINSSIKLNKIIKGDEALKLSKEILNNKIPFAISVDKLQKKPYQQNIFDNNFEETDTSEIVCSVTFQDKTLFLSGVQAKNFLISCLEVSKETDVIVEDTKKLFCILCPNDSSISSSVDSGLLIDSKIFDISLAGYILNSDRAEYSAFDVYDQIYKHTLSFDKDQIKIDKNVKDYIHKKNNQKKMRLHQRSQICYLIKDKVKDLLQQNDLNYVYYNIECPLVAPLVLMERCGIRINDGEFKKLHNFCKEKLINLQNEIYKEAGTEFNIDSPKQLGYILFEVLGLSKKSKTKSGYSTSAEVLEELKSEHILPSLVLEYRELSKLLSTYIDTTPKLKLNDGLIHTTYDQKKTSTGRLSSHDPNIQNIPVKTSLGSKIRECFVPIREDHLFLCADYSQIELRILAHLSQDEKLIKAFIENKDLHSATAANIFDCDIDKVSKKQRSIAKTVNFGIIYGQQAYGLSKTLSIPIKEAKSIIDKYFDTYTGVRDYLSNLQADAQSKGYATTIFGRRRYIPQIKSNNKFSLYAQRAALNHPMQGSAADIIKLAMINIFNKFNKNKLKSRCMIQVHDELDFSVEKNEINQALEIVKHEMQNVVKLRVPLIVDINYGENWYEAK